MPKPAIAEITTTVTTTVPGGEFITCKEAGALLKLTEIHIRRMLTQKKLTRYKAGFRTLLRKSEVLAFIREASTIRKA